MEHFKQTLIDLGVKNLILKKDGQVLWQFLREPQRLFNQYSVTKSFTALAVLETCLNGLLSLDSSVYDILCSLKYAQNPEQPLHFNNIENLAATPENKLYSLSDCALLGKQLETISLQQLTGSLPQKSRFAKLTLASLLNMTTGHSQGHLFIDERKKFASNFNWFDYCVHLDFARRPASYFLYTNAGPYMAGVIAQAITKKRLSQILAPLFVSGLNLKEVIWKQDTLGYEFGASELFLSTQTLSDCAEILRQGGLGYVSEKVIDLATRPSFTNLERGVIYGYGFWLYEDGAYQAYGSHGQYIMVDKTRRLSLAVNSDASCDRKLKDLLYTELIKSKC